MKLMTKELEKQIPNVMATDGVPTEEKVVYAKFFTPDGQWTWYAVEYDPQYKEFFGLIDGLDKEWGYFTLPQLESVRGALGLPVERDLHFKPTKVSDLR